MPLQSLKLPFETVAKLKRKMRQLIKDNLFHSTPKIDHSYTIGFCMHIHVVAKKQIESFAFGKPEGIRAFIQLGDSVAAAADFTIKNGRLKLSYLHHGPILKQLLSAMNKLEKKYSSHKEPCHAELIYFLLATGPYILIKSKKEKQFYQSTPEKLIPISAEQMKKQIISILLQREQTK
jgi:hypothetical protein